MLGIFFWWLSVEILGLVTWPLAFLAFKHLPDRGYFLSKPLGILVAAYFLWLAATFHVLPNSRGSILLIIFLLAGIATLIVAKNRPELTAFWQERKKLIIFTEILFAVGFLAAAFVRAYNPEIAGTEKPMEFAFVNAILRSDYFPPHDPWLSGFSISYYYFGYVMVALITKLSGVVPGAAFNLALSMLFALTLTGAFGIVYALVTFAKRDKIESNGRAPYFGGLIAALFVAVIGNLEGFLELLRSHGLGDVGLWQWIDIKDLGPAYQSLQWYPTDSWFWWRATRVISTVVDGRSLDYTITEFPFFSFLLGDLHPHVLALPFVFLALGLSVNLLFSPVSIGLDWFRKRPQDILFAGFVLGALGFLNSWDFPTYSAVFLGVVFIKAYKDQKAINLTLIKNLGSVTIPLMVTGILLYLPFYIGFRSQASGILTVRGVSTRPLHFFIIWGFFLFVVIGFLAFKMARERLWLRKNINLWLAGLFIALIPVALWILVEVGISVVGGSTANLLPAIGEKLSGLLLFIFLAWISAVYFLVQVVSEQNDPGNKSSMFVALMVLGGMLLFLVCELFFIKDVFGNRMNTVFKFYYQAWVLVALSAAYGLYYVQSLWSQFKISGRAAILVFWTVVAILMAAVTVYPTTAVMNKTNAFAGMPTLDGLEYVKRANSLEYDAIMWLGSNTQNSDIILESVGGQYSEFARVSTRTGLSTVLGWGGHELQWRGTDRDFKSREADIEDIYRSPDSDRVLSLLRTYNVRYVYVGMLEKNKYGNLVADKFRGVLQPAYQNDGVVIFKVS